MLPIFFVYLWVQLIRERSSVFVLWLAFAAFMNSLLVARRLF